MASFELRVARATKLATDGRTKLTHVPSLFSQALGTCLGVKRTRLKLAPKTSFHLARYCTVMVTVVVAVCAPSVAVIMMV